MKKILSMLFIALTLIVTTNAQTTQTGAQYAIDRIDQRSGTLSGTYTYDFDGSGIPVYIVDGELHVNHVEFGGRAVQVIDCPVPTPPNVRFPSEHATEVAGFVGSTTYGSAKNAPLKGIFPACFPSPYTSTSGQIVNMAAWLHDNVTPPAIIVYPYRWGSQCDLCDHSAQVSAINSSTAEGFTWVLSAGNQPIIDVCSTDIPQDAIIIGGIQRDNSGGDEIFGSSSYGSCLTVFAPLGGTTPTVVVNGLTLSNTATANVSGTSFSAPLVAGAIAQILQQYPTYTPGQIKQLLIDRSTKGMISGTLPANSPNRILYTRETYISGRVTNANGIALNNTNVELLDSSSNVIAETYTSSFGVYSFRELVPYNTYYVRPVSKRWRFATQQFTNLTETVTNADFEGAE